VLVAALAMLAGCVPTGPGPSVPTTTVKPSQNLGDGDLVTVNGSGFPANTPVVVVQCSQDPPIPDNCDLSAAQFLQTDGNGNVTTQYLVARKLLAGFNPDEFDCAVQQCVMAVTTLDVLTFDSHRITFDPNKPLAGPLQFTARIAGDGLVVESEGVAILHGTLTCNRGAFIELTGRFSQAFGRFLFRTDFDVTKTCPKAGTVSFAFPVEPDNGLYAAGPAHVRFTANGFANGSTFTQAETSHDVTLTAIPESDTSGSAAAMASTQPNSTPEGVVANLKSPHHAQSTSHW
jgi:neocarzinostatin family protein